MSPIIKEIIKDIKPPKFPPKSVHVGLHWTAVRSKQTGMSHTYKTREKVTVTNAGKLQVSPMDRLCKMAMSKNTLDASVGIAAVNSLISVSKKCEKGNVNSLFKKMARGKTVSIIGRFPTNDQVKKIAKKCYVLEFVPGPDEYPAEACEELIPKCDINLITATTLINHTIDRLLTLGSGGFNILLGPSTPFHDILFEKGVDILAGVKVSNHRQLTMTITQGVKKFKEIGGIEPIYLRRR